jgi:hypothetical protein
MRFLERDEGIMSGEQHAVAEWTALATHTDTGDEIEWDGIDLIQVRDGRICRNAVYSPTHRARPQLHANWSRHVGGALARYRELVVLAVLERIEVDVVDLPRARRAHGLEAELHGGGEQRKGASEHGDLRRRLPGAASRDRANIGDAKRRTETTQQGTDPAVVEDAYSQSRIGRATVSHEEPHLSR